MKLVKEDFYSPLLSLYRIGTTDRHSCYCREKQSNRVLLIAMKNGLGFCSVKKTRKSDKKGFKKYSEAEQLKSFPDFELFLA